VRRATVVVGLAAAVLLASAPGAAAQVQPFRADDAGGFHDVLPPGTNGFSNAAELGAFVAADAAGDPDPPRPAHNNDQLGMYENLVVGAALAARGSLYFGDAACRSAGRDGDQDCWDAVVFRPVRGISQPLIHWINRPTYQQAVEVEGTVPR